MTDCSTSGRSCICGGLTRVHTLGGWLSGRAATGPPRRCLDPLMALFDRLLGRPEPGPVLPPEQLYLPQDGDLDRFVNGEGLHLIPWQRGPWRTHELRLCDDSTGFLVGAADRRLHAANIVVSTLYDADVDRRAWGNRRAVPGQQVQLVRALNHPSNPQAVGVISIREPDLFLGWIKWGKSRTVANWLDAGLPLRAMSLRSSPCVVLVAEPHIVKGIRRRRPRHLPPPVREARPENPRSAE